jgi:hypothetical protein
MMHTLKLFAKRTLYGFWNSSMSHIISSHNFALEKQPKKQLDSGRNFKVPNSREIKWSYTPKLTKAYMNFEELLH